MKRLGLSSLSALILSMGFVTPQAGASELHLAAASKLSIVGVGAMGSMATIDWQAWLRYIFTKYFGSVWNHEPKGSVPIPGTLLLFGGGFVGLVIWRARQSTDCFSLYCVIRSRLIHSLCTLPASGFPYLPQADTYAVFATLA